MKKRLLMITIVLSIILPIFHLNSSADVYGNYIYTVTDGESTVTGILNTSLSSITIPSTLGGYPVTAIGDKAFQGNIKIETIIIPEGVTSIGEYTFYNCWNLKNINLPHSLKSIGKYAFCNCTSAEEICIPYSVSSIGSYAFSDCTKLKGVSIPSSLTSIATGTFSNCESLKYINIPTTVKEIGFYAFYYEYYYQRALEINYYGSEANFYGITISSGNDCFNVPGWLNYNISNTTVYSDDFTYTIKNNEITIEYVHDNGLSFNVPHTLGGCPVVCIGGNIYNIWEEDTLRTVELPTTITKIDDNAFYGCNYLQNIVIPNSVTEIGAYAFDSCYGLTGISLPKDINSIGIGAFRNCKNIQTIEIPSGITTIQNHTFSDCYSLKTVNLPENLECIGYNSFKDCTLISAVNFDGTKEQWDNIVINSGNDYLVKATVNYLIKVTGIAFNTNKLSLYEAETATLATIITPTNATNTDVNWKSSNTSVATVSNGVVTANKIGTADITVTTVDGSYTDSCKVAVSVEGVCGENLRWKLDADGVLTISGTGNMYNYYTDKAPWYTYYTYIKNIIIEDGVTSIGEQAFYDYNNIGSFVAQVSLSKSITTIGERAFARCIALNEISIPDNVTTLGNSALRECSALKSVTLGSGINNINDWMFWGDYKLEYINVSENNKYYCDIDGNLYSKDKTVLENYAVGKTDTTFVIPEGVVTLGYGAFYNCDNLTDITIPDTLTTIGECAFDNCSNIKTITMGKGIKEISIFAFDYCKNIKDVYYNGTKENWNNIVIDETNEYLLNATIHYAEKSTPIILLSAKSIYLSGISENCVLSVASYEESKLIDVKIIPISEDTTISISETELNTTNADTIKGFLWKDIQNLRPICDMKYITIK